MKKRLTAILTAVALMLTGCAGNVTSGTESQPASDVQSGISDNESSDTASVPENDASRYEIITATEMAEKMGLGISLGNTMEAYEVYRLREDVLRMDSRCRRERTAGL